MTVWSPFERRAIPVAELQYQETLLQRIWSKFTGPNIRGVVAFLDSLAVEVEAVLEQLQRQRDINEASGIGLARIARKTVTERPSGVSDEVFRGIVKVDTAVKFGNSTGRDIIRLVRQLFPEPDHLVSGGPVYPAKFRVSITNMSDEDVELARIVLDDLTAGGVGFIIDTFVGGDAGGWGTVTGPVPNPATWGTITDSTVGLSYWSFQLEITNA